MSTRAARISISLLAAVAALLAPTSATHGDEAYRATGTASDYADEANAERMALGLDALAMSEGLDRAAQMKAEDMAAKGYFSHTSPDGSEPWDWMDRAGYGYAAAGENLAVNFAGAGEVVAAWMDSPTHRANLEKGKYREVGTGVAYGEYKGRQAQFVVQMYAKPAADSAR